MISKSIDDAFIKMEQKIQSAKRKMAFNYGKETNKAKNSTKKSISNENEDNEKFTIKHNHDLLINTVDHSDIKHTAKTLFNRGESTAPMTGKDGKGG